MSRTVNIALVAEGVTDYVVLNAAIESMLGDQSFDLKLLQPEGSVAFTGGGDAGQLGGGWKGVYRWCRQAALRGGGTLSGDPLFIGYDLLLIHLDADVASDDPANAPLDPIPELAGVMPCVHPCPPPSTTTDSLRAVILSWAGENAMPPQTVICTPSKSIEAWVMAVFFPKDKEMARQGWECHPAPAMRLAQQRIGQRFSKTQAHYEMRKSAIKVGWPAVVARLGEASRFQDDFMAAIAAAPGLNARPDI